MIYLAKYFLFTFKYFQFFSNYNLAPINFFAHILLFSKIQDFIRPGIELSFYAKVYAFYILIIIGKFT